jgi:hypothetical protein
MAAVRTAHRDLAELSGSLDGLQGTERISSLLEATPSISWPEASQFSMIVFPLHTLPVTDLLTNYLDLWKVFFDNLLDAIRSADGGFIV